jgi:rRNA maturation protein Nop10
MLRERCPNDNHGRAIVTVRFCPNCGEIVNGNLPARKCSEEEHAMRRRARYTYCVDCGERLIQGR